MFLFELIVQLKFGEVVPQGKRHTHPHKKALVKTDLLKEKKYSNKGLQNTLDYFWGKAVIYLNRKNNYSYLHDLWNK